VDACLGGFLLPWLKRLGYPVGPFDLSVEGVCSISADLHKYGFAAKGASVLLYRDEALRRHQFFACADWPGGLYASPGMTGTRPGGAVGAAWAALHALGEAGYLKMAEGVMGTTRTLMEGIEAIPGLYVLGKPDMTVFAFGSESLDIYLVAEAMARRGWHVDMQQLPPCAHLMVMPTHAPVADTFLADLREAAGEAAAADRQDSTGMAALYGMMGALVDRKAAEPFLLDYLSALFRPEA
jgi:glutamate/tyrosine decarboxylase-like PLP-dependent enzyme